MGRGKEYWIRWFWAALIRSLRTVAQTAVALIGTNAVGITEVDWVGVASGAALAGIVSILMSIGGIPEVKIEDVETKAGDEDDPN